MAQENNLLLKYAGLATQMLVGIGLMAFAGFWIDERFIGSFPIFVWVLPLLLIIGTIIKIIKDTSKP